MPTYTNSKATPSGDVVVSIGPLTGSTGTETFTAITEVYDASFSGAKRNILNPTNFSSTAVEKLDSPLADFGQVKLSYNRIPNDPGQLALVAAFQAGGAYDFKVQLPVNTKIGQSTTGDLYAFSAIVSAGPEFDLNPEKLTQVTVTLDINGAPVFTTGS